MVDPFVAEIRILPYNFVPKGWAACNGQLLPISQNTALFSLLGTTYGGDGKTTFALPNLEGRAPMQWGSGPGLTPRSLGEQGGADAVTLLDAQMPQHTHQLNASNRLGRSGNPTDNALATSSGAAIYTANPPDTQMNFQALARAGSSAPHNNLQPYLTMQFCIALQGVYPPRS